MANNHYNILRIILNETSPFTANDSVALQQFSDDTLEQLAKDYELLDSMIQPHEEEVKENDEN